MDENRIREWQQLLGTLDSLRRLEQNLTNNDFNLDEDTALRLHHHMLGLQQALANQGYDFGRLEELRNRGNADLFKNLSPSPRGPHRHK